MSAVLYQTAFLLHIHLLNSPETQFQSSETLFQSLKLISGICVVGIASLAYQTHLTRLSEFAHQIFRLR